MDIAAPAPIETKNDAFDASFDIVARQDAQDEALAAIRTDIEEVKGRLDKVGRAAIRPLLAGGAPAGTQMKGFVDGYLRHGRESELKSLSQGVAADGGYAVPREIDEVLAKRLAEISPIRSIASVVRTGTSGFRRLISIGGTASGWVSKPPRGPKPPAPSWPRSRRRGANSMPTRPPRRPCWMTPRSTWRSGWPARSPPSSRGPRARPSSTAAAPTSPRAS
jgi:predicted phage gp36 major capsid-like protein